MSDVNAWAEYYDLVHEGLAGECAFYVGQALRWGGAALELGCGTGRIALPMAMSGVDVTGLDNAPDMLAVCREKLDALGPVKGAVRLVEADMAAFDLGQTFPFIAMAYRTFMHLTTPEAQCACLRAVRRHLADGGRFILNTWAARPSSIVRNVAGPLAGRLRTVGRYEAPEAGEVIVHKQSARCDEFRQLLIEDHRLEVFNEDGLPLREVKLPLVRAWTTPREMLRLVQLCGFETVDLLGDFDGGPFTPESTEMIWVLRGAREARS